MRKRRLSRLISLLIAMTMVFSSVSGAFATSAGTDYEAETIVEPVIEEIVPDAEGETPEAEIVLPAEETAEPDAEEEAPAEETAEPEAEEEVPAEETAEPEAEEEAPAEETAEPEAEEEAPAEESAEPEAEEEAPAEEPAEPEAEVLEPVELPEEISLDEAQGLLFAEPQRMELMTMLGAPLMAVPEPEQEQGWSFNIYYINYSNAYASEKSDYVMNLLGDGSSAAQPVKYQFEFHCDEEFAPGEIEIAIPQALYTDRDGNDLVPSDIGVPEAPAVSRSSPFNYTVEEIDGVNCMVFTNQKTLVAGSNTLVQVFYQLDDMLAIDASSDKEGKAIWNIKPVLTLRGEECESEAEISGMMDTGTTLKSVRKLPYFVTSSNLYPELYTWNQVRSSGKLSSTEEPEDFDQYRYIVWETTITGSASQPWLMTITDTPENDGVVVSQYLIDSRGYQMAYSDSDTITLGPKRYYCLDSYGSQTIRLRTLVKYPIDSFPDDCKVFNNIFVALEGIDDEYQNILTSSSSHVWEDYVWHYAGDVFSCTKFYSTDRLEEAWLSVYEIAQEQGIDFSLPLAWNTDGSIRYFRKDNPRETPFGLVTVDDHHYVRSDVSNYVEMTDKDYYFSSVSFEINEYDIDIYEDTTLKVKTGQPFDIYCMVKDSDEWEFVEEVAFEDINSYVISDEWLEKGIWKVKVEHQSNNYSFSVDINAKTCIRQDSPLVAALKANPEMSSLTFMDISGSYAVIGGTAWYANPVHTTNIGGTIAEDLLARDAEEYGGPLYRTRDTVQVTRVTGANGARKDISYKNDPANSRVNLTYTASGWDGYKVYSANGITALKNYDLTPSRNMAVFYDLLPSGIIFDPSQPITVGRLTSQYSDYDLKPGSWNKTNVNCTYKVTDNYRGSNRQMVEFTVRYTGPEGENCAYMYNEDVWRSGFGISFGAYFSWEDYNIAGDAVNVIAYATPEDSDAMHGMKGNAHTDDGVGVPAAVGSDLSGKNYYYDLDEDGVISDVPFITYAQAAKPADIAVAARADIRKYVRADQNSYAEYLEDAAVPVSGGFSYMLQVENANNKSRGIIVYDHLDEGIVDRDAIKDLRVMENESWKGGFAGLNLSDARKAGAAPEVFYSAAADQQTSLYDDMGELVEGWVAEADWTDDLSAVKSIAVDLSKKADGSEFILGTLESIKFLVYMTAPSDLADAHYAYNVPIFDSYAIAADGNESYYPGAKGGSTGVRLYKPVPLSVEKQITADENAPLDEDFTFTVKVDDIAFANIEYKLYDADGSAVSGIFATDVSGRFSIKAGQKAVFPSVPTGSDYQVEEEYSASWEASPARVLEGVIGDDGTELVFTNTYKYPLYFEKRTEYEQDYTNANDDEFTFALTVNGETAANFAYYLVDRTTAVSKDPKILSDRLFTDENGVFKLRADQRAMFLTDKGDIYRFDEQDIPEDYTCATPYAEATVEKLSTLVYIMNQYKWKDLYLTKELLMQAGAEPDVTSSFDFVLTLDDTTADVSYILYERGVDPETNADVWLRMVDDDSDENGIRTAVGGAVSMRADQQIRFVRLASGSAWKVTEIDNPDDMYDFSQPADGVLSGTLPKYGLSAKANFVNCTTLRTLEISKTVLSSDGASGVDFTFTLTVDGVPAANYVYTLIASTGASAEFSTDDSGCFTLADGQKAVFNQLIAGSSYSVHEMPASGYTQISPADGGDAEGVMPAELSAESVSFLNMSSDSSSMVIVKKEVSSEIPGVIEKTLTGTKYNFTRLYPYSSPYSYTYTSDVYGWGYYIYAFHLDIYGSDGARKDSAGVPFTLIDGEGTVRQYQTLSEDAEAIIYPRNELRSCFAEDVTDEQIDAYFKEYSTYSTINYIYQNTGRYDKLSYENGEDAALETFTAGDFAMRSTDTIIFSGLEEGDRIVVTEYPYQRWCSFGMNIPGHYLLPIQTEPANGAPAEAVMGGENPVATIHNEWIDVLDLDIYKMIDYEEAHVALFERQTDASFTFRIQLRDKDGNISTPEGAFVFKFWDHNSEYVDLRSDANGYFTVNSKFCDTDRWIFELYGVVPRGYDIKVEEISAEPEELCGVLECCFNWEGCYMDEDGFLLIDEWLERTGYSPYIDVYFSNITTKETFTVAKELGANTQSDEEFSFTIYESDPPAGRSINDASARGLIFPDNFETFGLYYHPWVSAPYTVYSSEDDTKLRTDFTDANGQFKLKAGEYAAFEGIGSPDEVWRPYYYEYTDYPAGYWRTHAYWNGIHNLEEGHIHYRVVEDTYPDYETTVTVKNSDGSEQVILGNRADILPTKDLVFTNSRAEKQSLVITKEVVAETGVAIPDDTFTFTLNVDDKPYKDQEYLVYDANGEVLNIQEIDGYTVELPWTTDRYGTFTLKNGQRAVFDWVGEGSGYEVTEEPLENYMQIIPAEGTTANGQISSAGAVAAFTNKYIKPDAQPHAETGSLTVYKQLAVPSGVNPAAIPDADFMFSLELNNMPVNMTEYKLYSMDGTYIETKNTNYDGEFTLKGNQYAVFANLPANVDFMVTELPDDSGLFRRNSGETVEGAISRTGSSAVFVNRFGELLVSKRVTSNALSPAPSGDVFSFCLSLDGAPAVDAVYLLLDSSGSYISSGLTDEEGCFKLKGGQMALFAGLEAGTAYKVTEAGKRFYTQTIPASVEDGYSGIVKTSAVSLLFENYFERKAALEIEKIVVGNPADTSAEFIFALTVNDAPYADKVFALYGADGFVKSGTHVTDADGRFTLLGGELASFEGLLAGVKYSVAEEDIPEGYIASGDTFKSGKLEESGSEVSFVNISLGNLKITKTVEDANGDAVNDDTPFRFTVSLKDSKGNDLADSYELLIDGVFAGTLTSGDVIELCSGQTAMVMDIPGDTSYEVTEEEAEGYITYANGEESTGCAGLIRGLMDNEADFVNALAPLPELRIINVTENDSSWPADTISGWVQVFGRDGTPRAENSKDSGNELWGTKVRFYPNARDGFTYVNTFAVKYWEFGEDPNTDEAHVITVSGYLDEDGNLITGASGQRSAGEASDVFSTVYGELLERFSMLLVEDGSVVIELDADGTLMPLRTIVEVSFEKTVVPVDPVDPVGPTPHYDPDDDPEPEEEPPVPPVLPEEPVEIEEPETPLTDMPAEEPEPEIVEEIPEEDVPLADVPATGDRSGIWAFMCMAIATILGVLELLKKKRAAEL